MTPDTHFAGNTAENMNDYDYTLYGKVPIAGFYTEDGPLVELGAIQVVPEGQYIYSDEPVRDESYKRKARVGLTPEEAREVANALVKMADRVDKDSDN